MKLTEKQIKFAENYLTTGNGTQSYIDAGYKATTRQVAEANARRLLANDSVKTYVNQKRKELADSNKWTRDRLIKEFEDVKEKCMQAQKVFDSFGKPTGEYKFDSNGAIKSLENIGKLCGLYEEKIKHSGNIPVMIVDDV